MSGSGRTFLTVDGPDGWAVRITDADAGPIDSEADSVTLPAGVSHLLAADDALMPGRWGVHITLCGQQVRGPRTTAVECDCSDCPERYCPECVREVIRESAEVGDRVPGAGDQMATR